MKFQGKITATVEMFNSENAKVDKHGKLPVVLNVTAGTYPNRTILSGTYAETLGFELNKCYLIQVTEEDEDEDFGRQFRFQKIKELTFMEIIQADAILGQPKKFEVGVEETTTGEIPAVDVTLASAPSEEAY